MEHVKSVLEASVDYHYPNHPEPKAEPGDMGEVSDGYHTFNEKKVVSIFFTILIMVVCKAVIL